MLKLFPGFYKCTVTFFAFFFFWTILSPLPPTTPFCSFSSLYPSLFHDNGRKIFIPIREYEPHRTHHQTNREAHHSRSHFGKHFLSSIPPDPRKLFLEHVFWLTCVQDSWATGSARSLCVLEPMKTLDIASSLWSPGCPLNDGGEQIPHVPCTRNLDWTSWLFLFKAANPGTSLLVQWLSLRPLNAGGVV